jgi:hypothetical protein
MMRRLLVACAAAAALCAFVPAAQAQTNGARLTFTPIGAVVGTPVTAHALVLPPNARFALIWRSTRPSRRVEGPKFYGIVAPETPRALLVASSDGSERSLLASRCPKTSAISTTWSCIRRKHYRL